MAQQQGTVTITVLYPRDEGSTFDMKYYLSTHLPMVEKAWKPHGAKNWNVIEIPAGPDGKAPYSAQAIVAWEPRGENGLDGVIAATTSEEGKAVSADVPNFSNRQPVVCIGGVVGSASL